MSNDCTYACPEYNEVSRRGFLGVAGGTLTLAALAPAWMPRVALGKNFRSSQRDVIVSIFLRGAADGLSMCVPFGTNDYYSARPTIGVPRPDSGLPNAATNLDGFFGLPPALAPLIEPYNNGHLAIVHATGLTDPTRSHFDAQRFMEVGKANDASLFTGWLGRHVSTVAPMVPSAPLRAIGISSALQRALSGAPQSLPIPNLDAFNLTGSSGTITTRSQAIEDMYASVADPLRSNGLNTFNTIDLLNQIDFAGYVPGGSAAYPANTFGTAMKQAAALIKAQIGVEAIAVDVGGWDTHATQGVTTGTMANLMTTLAGGMLAFYRDMFAATNPSVCVVAMSEFGRRVRENASAGTDHGHGNCMFVLGNAVAGGRVVSTWPGIGAGQLFENLDLQVTTDYRSVLAEIVQQRLGNPNLAAVFPAFTASPVGLFN